jgi:flagellar basal body-associated protein FliL
MLKEVMDKEDKNEESSAFFKKWRIVLFVVIIFIIVLGGYLGYQHFVLKKEIGSFFNAEAVRGKVIRMLLFLGVGVIAIGGYLFYQRSSWEVENKKRALKLGSLVALIIIAITGAYFSYQYYRLKNELGTQAAGQEETQKIVSAVGKLMLLPTETPTVATVADVDKLKDQPFFEKAKNGDKILIYTDSKEAILYNPEDNIIVAVAPVSIGGQPTTSSPAKIGLLNGTNTPGLTYKVEADIVKAFPGATVSLKQQAKRIDYEKTLIVPLKDEAKGASEDLAKQLSAEVSALPPNEVAPADMDILVIIGRDRT